MTGNAMKRFLLSALALSLLSGCLGSAPAVPRDRYFRLMVAAPEMAPTTPLFPGVVMVEQFQADGLLRERPLLYSESGDGSELQKYDYHFWTDTPPRMFQDQMVAYLRRGGLARSVVTPEMRVRSDFMISGRTRRLERLLGQTPPRVYVEVEIALIRLSDDALILVDSFGMEETAADGSIEASVEALNRATARVFERFLERAALASRQLAAQ